MFNMKEKDDGEPEDIFIKIESKKYDSSCCFLCGQDLVEQASSEEHVFPKWLQNKFDLWDQTITLLNRTHIQYRFLKIPCCNKCNNLFLSPIENIVKSRLECGFDNFKNIERESLFYWLGKIYYGLLYKELFLLYERSTPSKGSILTAEFLKQLKAHYLFLQGIRGKHRFEEFFPASIFIFNTQTPSEIEQQWDFIDNIDGMFIAIRMGEIGVIATLQDGGAQESMKDLLEDFHKIKLHPIQFREVAAIISYKSTLFNRNPKYISFGEKDSVATIQMPLGGLSSKPIFDDYDEREYANVLSQYTGIPVDSLNPEPGRVMTMIKDDNGEINFIDIKDFPMV